MKKKYDEILNRLYSQANRLGSYSHHLSASDCSKAFAHISDIVLAVKTGDDEQYELAEKALSRLDELVHFAEYGKTTETVTEEEPVPIPKSVEEAVAMLDKELSDTDKRYVLENGSLSVHHTLGMWIRNNWGLWQDSELKQLMLGLGIEHPDDMSDYIINRFIEHIEDDHAHIC